jgi:heme/copper-type cytochrome/quinol oxidase subunit 2
MQTQNSPYSDAEVSAFTSKVVVGFFGALGLVATIIVAIAVIVACSINRPTLISLKGQPTVTRAAAVSSGAAKPVAATFVDQRVQTVVYLSVSPGIKPGADGKLHDAWSQTDFAVHVGQPVKLVVNNTDDVPHSISSPAAGVNIVARPGTHTYTLLVTKAGTFQWFCGQPCDPYSMTHDGYMHGTIVAS